MNEPSPWPIEDTASTVLTTALAHFHGLPAPVAKPALAAFSQLIGGVVAIPAAALHQKAQAINDTTEARTAFSRAITGAAIERAVSDPQILDRALHRLAGEEARRQKNREAVAREAHRDLLAKPAPAEEAVDPDPDWMNIFVRYAEDASSERARDLWGRILSGQIRKKGSFSLSTLRFLAELDADIAALFEHVGVHIYFNEYLLHRAEMNTAPLFGQLLDLEDAGLVTNAAHPHTISYNTTDDGSIALISPAFYLHLKCAQKQSVEIPVVRLTRIGREVAMLLPDQQDHGRGRLLFEAMDGPGVLEAILHPGHLVGTKPDASSTKPIVLKSQQGGAPDAA